MERVKEHLTQSIHIIERMESHIIENPSNKNDFERIKWIEVKHLHKFLDNINFSKLLSGGAPKEPRESSIPYLRTDKLSMSRSIV